MNIAFNIEQHRRQRARTAITAAVTDHARTEYKHAVPPPGTGPLTLLTWAGCIELALRVLADSGELRAHGVTSALDVAGVRARYVDSARHDVPVVLDFRGTALGPLCEACEELSCVCPSGPVIEERDIYQSRCPRLEPRSEADIELLAAAGYQPCNGNGCRDWLLPEETIEGRCAACYVADEREKERVARGPYCDECGEHNCAKPECDATRRWHPGEDDDDPGAVTITANVYPDRVDSPCAVVPPTPIDPELLAVGDQLAAEVDRYLAEQVPVRIEATTLDPVTGALMRTSMTIEP